MKGYISISSHLEIKVKKSSSKCLQDYMKKRETVSIPIFGVLNRSLTMASGLGGAGGRRCHTPSLSYVNAQRHKCDTFLVCVQCSD